MDILELLREDIFNITSEINKYQFNILTNKSKLDDLITVDTRYEIIKTGKDIIPYLLRKNDDTFYVPLDGGEKIHLFNIDVDKSSENNYYITDSILVQTLNESVDYNEYGLPDKNLYKINNIAEIDKAITNFKFCEESCKPELAKNIIQRFQELDYKPLISSKNEFFKYTNKDDVEEVEALYDKFLKVDVLANSNEEYGWLADKAVDPIRSNLKQLLKTNKIGNGSKIISDFVDYSKYLQSDLLSKANEINYLINAFNMRYLNRFIKTASNKLDNVVLAKLKLSNRFKELFIKTNNIGDELVFGVDKNFLALIVRRVDNDDIILIPLIDNQGINKNNISALCLGDTDIKMRVRKLMVKSKGVRSESLTEGINQVNDNVNFSVSCESLEEFEYKMNSYNIEITTMLQEKNHDGVLEALACLLCLHSQLENYKLDKITSLEESRMCDNILIKTRRLFKEGFSKAQKIKPVNFTQYCSESASIRALFDGSERLSVIRQLRKIIL